MELRYIGRRLAAISLLIAAAALPAIAADGVDAVLTPRAGTLTMCRNWLVTNSCTTYNKVALPERVAVGDQVKLTFGSSPKKYTFRVAHIRRDGPGCTILSELSAPSGEGEKIEIAHCAITAAPAP